MKTTLISLIVLLCIVTENSLAGDVEMQEEKATIEDVIKNSIGWALTKDKDLLYSTLANDSTLFFYNPDDSFVDGFDQFQETVDGFFMDDRFKATAFDVKDMRIQLSQSRDVAWWACILNDYGEWDGRSTSWINTRWTGVLEKMDGQWRIRQMHFSFPEGKRQAEEDK